MNFISTSNAKLKASFKQAVLSGLAPDGGLYVPELLPEVFGSITEIQGDTSHHELAFQLLNPFVSDDLTDEQLRSIIAHTFQFAFPITELDGSGIEVLELFHGPTWAFKDAGARFLAGCMSAWKEDDNKKIILVATSGDTGGAVANGFFNQEGAHVVILYPKGKISPLQEFQVAGLGGNITALAVEGSFDDCQRLVKSALSDESLRSKVNITSANSINVARWLPQVIWHVIAHQYLKRNGRELIIAVPSGNYGNIAAAFLAHVMGFIFKKILAAHNANDTIPRFLMDGVYNPGTTISTLANAMDVSDPSNFVRLQYLMQHQYRGRLAEFQAMSVSDDQILKTIHDVWHQHQYLLDPHTATAWYCLQQQNENGIVVATAHPFKFQEVIVRALGFYPEEWIKSWDNGNLHSISIPATYAALEDLLYKPG